MHLLNSKKKNQHDNCFDTLLEIREVTLEPYSRSCEGIVSFAPDLFQFSANPRKIITDYNHNYLSRSNSLLNKVGNTNKPMKRLIQKIVRIRHHELIKIIITS